MDKHFSPSMDFIPPDIRSRKVASVYENLKRSERYTSDQQRVWNDVFFRLNFAKVESDSINFEDYVRSQNKMMEEITPNFKKHKDTTGIAGFINGNFIGCDIIPQPEIFGHIFERLIRSYSLDALYFQNKDVQAVEYKEQVEKLFSRLDDSKQEIFPSPGVGDSVRISGENISGSALIYRIAVIHLAVFSLKR